MRKNPIEEKEERSQDENQSKMNTAAGGKVLKLSLSALIVIVIILALFYLTRYSQDTFSILK